NKPGIIVNILTLWHLLIKIVVENVCYYNNNLSVLSVAIIMFAYNGVDYENFNKVLLL
ncbi:MAG: hypothetical protein K0R23_1529, partial [Lacrimispora sp.]|nr:hypothetical protein [Lacrimispora sp.]